MNQILDVIVIGAGPAGTLLAHKLAKAGLKITVLERNPTVKRKVCGEYLCPIGVELLKQEDLEEEIVGQFLSLRGMLIVTAHDTRVETDFPYPESFHGVSVNRQVFDANLIRRAQDSGASVKMGEEVKKIYKRGEFWEVETSQGTYRGRILVGADGRKSAVSRYFDNDIELKERRVALHAFAQSKRTNDRLGEMHLFNDGAYIGINPTGESEVNFSLVLDSAKLQKLGGPKAALNHYLASSSNLRDRFELFENDKEILSAFPIQHRTKSIIPGHNVALIGDAAGFVDPLTGEGMYNALLSAQLLADEIKNAYEKSLVFSSEAFKNYEKQYSKVLRHKINLNRFFQSLIRYPKAIECVAWFLLTRKKRADAFIGIVGNIYSPFQGLIKLLI